MEKVSKIPAPLRFPLAYFLSLGLSLLLFSLTSNYTAGDLAAVSKVPNEWWEPVGLTLWRGVELGVCWGLGYDGNVPPTLTNTS